MTTPVLSGDQLTLNTDVTGTQNAPRLAALSDGRFVAVWMDSTITGQDIKAQIWLADGTPDGPAINVLSFSDSNQNLPDITTLTNGGFVVTWTTAGGTGGDGSLDAVKARVFDSAGVPVGNEFQVNSIAQGRQSLSSVIALDDGGFAVGFQTPSGSDDIAMRLFDADGTPRGAQFPAASGSAIQRQADVAQLDNGNIVVVWHQLPGLPPDDSKTSVAASIFTAAGVLVTGSIGVNTSTPGDQLDAEVAALAGGGFVVTWMDNSRTGGDTSFNAVRAQRFDNDGNKLGGEILVNTSTTGNQNAPAIIGLSDGRFIIAWTDQGSTAGWDITAQLFNNDGSPSGSEFVVSGVSPDNQTGATLTELSDGRVAVGWFGPLGAGEALDIGGQIIDPREAAIRFAGTAADDIAVGTRFNDRMDGGSGNDRLFGANGNDRLNGGRGNDTLNGSNGDDTQTGGGGSDSFVFDIDFGSDRVTDFRDNVDTLVLDAALWGGGLTVAQVISNFASVVVGGVLFDFGDDEVLFSGAGSTAVWLDDIVIV